MKNYDAIIKADVKARDIIVDGIIRGSLVANKQTGAMQLTDKRNNVTVTKYVPKRFRKDVKRMSNNYKKLKKLIVKLSDLNLKLLLSE